MEKPFFDVFPTLELNTELKNLFAVTKVTRVALTKARDFLKVYLFSEKLIQKKYIYQVEKAIRDQLFAGVQMTVKIIEKFSLSRQYTPEKLMDVYKDSILLELKEYSIFEFNLFRKADCIFENEDTLHLTLEETVISEGKGDELIRVLEKIFTERCGMSLKIRVDYKEAVESKARRNGELKIQQESLCKLIVHKFIVLLKYSIYFPVCKDTHNNNAYHCFLIYISITKCMPSFDRLNGLNKNKGYSELFTK